MDKLEAKIVLQAVRTDQMDTKPVGLDEALALVEGDPELKEWWETWQAFDRKVATKLTEISPPDDLRAAILGTRKIEPFAPQPHLPLWLAAAAAVAILCLIGTYWENSRHVSSANYDDAALAFLGHDAPALGMTSSDHAKIVAWLKENDAPMGDMPSKMAALPGVGCQKFLVQGHRVSLLCFMLAEGKLVHLFIVDQNALSDPPNRNAPVVREVQGWSTASWSDDHMSYMLATQAGPDALRQLL